jgi:hypothetical protein
MNRSWLRRTYVVGLAAATSLVGCRSWFRHERPPLTAPPAVLQVAHFAGTALSGPQATVPSSTNAWGVTANVVAIASTPPGFVRIGPAARLVLGPDTGSVVLPSARLIYSTLFRSLAADESLALGDALNQVAMQKFDAAVVAGATASLEITLPEGTPVTAVFARRAARVELSRRPTGDAYDLAIVSDDLTNAAPGAASSGSTARELILVQRTLGDGGDHFAIAIPMTFPQSAAKSLVIEVTVNGEAGDAAVAEMQRQIDGSAAAVVAARSSPLPTQDELALVRSLDLLGTAGTLPRTALTFLAERTGAELSHTVALVADDRLLQVIARQVQSRLTQLPSRDRRSVAWLLDRATIDALAGVKEEDAARVLAPIEGALSIYAGEAGRQLDVLRSLAGESASSDDLYKRIAAENVILLEESSPGRRVRAYEWLQAAGLAPAGYDPLATPQQRRAALERSREGGTTQPDPTTSPTPLP